MTPHDTILISIPYPEVRKVRPFPWTKQKQLTVIGQRVIGFSFTNMSKMLFAFHNDLTGTKDFEEYRKTHGDSRFVSEQLYYCALAYSTLSKTEENFTKDELLKSFALMDVDTFEQIKKVWRASEYFGATVKPSKKKATAKM